MITSGRRIASAIATNCTVAFHLPSIEVSNRRPPAATAARSPRIVNSRPTMISATHGEARSTATSAISALGDQQLVGGRVQERAELRGHPPAAARGGRRTSRSRRRPGTRRGGRVGARQHERHDHRAQQRSAAPVPAASSRDERNVLKVPASTGGRGYLRVTGRYSKPAPSARAASAVSALERRRARPLGPDRDRRPAALLDLGDQRRRHAQLGHAEAGEQHRRRGVAGELAAHPDPAAVRGRAARTVALTSRRTAGWGPVEQRREPLVAALGGHRVLGQVVGAEREEVDVRGQPRRRSARPRGPRP